jgi:hypothetical protein
VFSKQHILDEIKRTAAENGGVALGAKRFYSVTGIRAHEWNRYWARWGDAVGEAGVEQSTWIEAYGEETLIRALADETAKLGHFPTVRELAVRRNVDPTFPSAGAFRRFAGQRALLAKTAAYCAQHPELANVAAILEPLLDSDSDSDNGDQPAPAPSGEAVLVGFVYLMRSGRYYKIGRTNADGRRQRELEIQLPDKLRRVHVIKTDDPVGIERYWHQRFADRRVRPDAEWFDLTAEDVAVFRRRAFQ